MGKSKNKEIINKLNELIQFLKDELVSSNLEESLETSSNNYFEEYELTRVISFERKI